ncbi:predicted protein [Sclerotinia sclerotiorum 1980 UF-70]|uniref:Uncharacterized protein n=1 Tax=Sclerotinia sclerotiorum (strain ATCC 18683 / 1980 / Ss-1) TaxID=665079 RepID=A7EM06_SCLS1|nr:predicted protein [Sclerotinia sclerotiorum 1980 UF-70]EDO03872.1 predicted protein [Sclerotinia sclerotiorum 1980 UF-70]
MAFRCDDVIKNVQRAYLVLGLFFSSAAAAALLEPRCMVYIDDKFSRRGSGGGRASESPLGGSVRRKEEFE